MLWLDPLGIGHFYLPLALILPLATWVLLIGLFAAIDSNPFIYFQF